MCVGGGVGGGGEESWTRRTTRHSTGRLHIRCSLDKKFRVSSVRLRKRHLGMPAPSFVVDWKDVDDLDWALREKEKESKTQEWSEIHLGAFSL